MGRKVKNILIILFVIIGIASISVGVVLMLQPSDKELFTESFKKNFNNVSDVEKDNDFVLGNILDLKEDLKIKLTTDTSIESLLDTASIKGDFYLDNYAQKLYTTFDVTSNLEKYSVEAILKDSKLYHIIKDVYSKYYYTEVDLFSDDDTNDEVNIDFTVILDYLEEAVIEHVNNDNLTIEDKKITLGDENFNAKKYTVNFTQKDVISILKSIVDKVKDNKELYNYLSELFTTATSGDNLDSYISMLDEMLENSDDTDTFISYIMYSDGDDVISNEVAISIESEESTVTLRFTINSYENKSGYNNFEIYLSAMGIKVFSFEILGTSDTKSNISMNILNSLNVEGTLESSDSKFNLVLNGSIPETTTDDFSASTELKEFLSLDLLVEEAVENKEYNINLLLDLSTDEKVNINSVNKLLIGEEVPDIDVSNSADMTEMTDAEMEVFNKLFGNFIDNGLTDLEGSINDIGKGLLF